MAVSLAAAAAVAAAASRKRRRTADVDAASNAATRFENVPRRTRPEWMSDSHTRLPLKMADGSVRRQVEGRGEVVGGISSVDPDSSGTLASWPGKPAGGGRSSSRGAPTDDGSEGGDSGSSEDTSDGEEDGDSENDTGDAQKRPIKRPPADVLNLPGGHVTTYAALLRLPSAVASARRNALKERIATLAQQIIASPELNVSAPRAGKEEKVRGGGANARVLTSRRSNSLLMLHQLGADPDPTIRKLSLLSGAAVFTDILPGYRIKEDSAETKTAAGSGGANAVRLKKEVAKLREYEANLLRGYSRFLRYLEHTVLQAEAAEARLAAGKGLVAAVSSDAGAAADASSSSSSVPSSSPGSRRGTGFETDAFDDAAAGAAPDTQTSGGRMSTKDFNAANMAQKRSAQAARDGLGPYDGDDVILVSLGSAAIDAMCGLLTSLPHFNFRSNLVRFLVPRMALKRSGDGAEDAALKTTAAVEAVFGGSGEANAAASTEIVAALAEAVKGAASAGKRSSGRSGGLLRVRSAAVAALTKLKLAVLERSDSRERDAKSMTTQQQQQAAARRKRHVTPGHSSSSAVAPSTSSAGGGGGGGAHNRNPFDQDDIAAGLRASDAEALGARKAHAVAALKSVIGIAFRVLRASPPRSAAHLLPAVMTVLSRFAHLIDVGVVSDLLACLKGLLRTSGGSGDSEGGGAPTSTSATRLSVPAALHAVLAALRILSGPGEALLNADETEFARALFGTLWRVCGGGGGAHCDESTALLVAQAVSALLLSRREYSPVRAAAFSKRLLQCALAVSSPAAALPLLSVVRALCSRYGRVADTLLSPFPNAVSAAATAASSAGAPKPTSTSMHGVRLALAPLVALVDGEWGAITDPDTAVGAAAAAVGGGASLGSGGISGGSGGIWGAGAGASTGLAWELGSLCGHYHPAVAAFALGTAKKAGSTPATAPDVLRAAFDDSTGNFNPPIALPRPHPIAVRLEKAAAAAAGASSAGATGGTAAGGGSDDDDDDAVAPQLSRRQKRREQRKGLRGGSGSSSSSSGDRDDDDSGAGGAGGFYLRGVPTDLMSGPAAWFWSEVETAGFTRASQLQLESAPSGDGQFVVRAATTAQ